MSEGSSGGYFVKPEGSVAHLEPAEQDYGGLAPGELYG